MVKATLHRQSPLSVAQESPEKPQMVQLGQCSWQKKAKKEAA
jgi:hypothetical protein